MFKSFFCFRGGRRLGYKKYLGPQTQQFQISMNICQGLTPWWLSCYHHCLGLFIALIDLNLNPKASSQLMRQ